MDEATRALAAEAVTLRRWRWMPGMLYWLGERDAGDWGRVEDAWADDWAPPEGAWPDLADPATLGCLLALVREAWGDPHLVAIYCEAAHPGQSEGWGVQTADNRLPIDGVGDHPTEVHALVAALRAAGHDSGHDASKGAP